MEFAGLCIQHTVGHGDEDSRDEVFEVINVSTEELNSTLVHRETCLRSSIQESNFDIFHTTTVNV